MLELPNDVKTIIEEYLNKVDSRLPNLVVGLYIYGSISLGAYTKGLSDIDFLAVTDHIISKSELAVLKKIHLEIKKKFKDTDFMGYYVLVNELEDNYNQKNNPFFVDGVLKEYEKFDFNSIDAYQLKKFGITIRGKEISDYSFSINMDELLKMMKVNLNTYWVNWLRGSRNLLSPMGLVTIFSLNAIDWGVLGVTRQYYSFMNRDITSKEGAGEYALLNLPEKWHKIVRESMRQRKGIAKSYYTSPYRRKKDMIQYMDFIIELCNKA